MTIDQRADRKRAERGERVLAEGDLADEPGEQIEREYEDGGDRRQRRQRAVVIREECRDRDRQDDRGSHGHTARHGRPHTALLLEKPGRNRMASVPSTRMKLTNAPMPAPLKNARGYVSARPRNMAPTNVH